MERESEQKRFPSRESNKKIIVAPEPSVCPCMCSNTARCGIVLRRHDTTISRQRADTDALRPSNGAALTAALETFKDKTARHVSLLAQATKCVPEATKIHRGRTADLRVPNLEGLGYCDRVGLSGGAGVCWVVPPWSLWPHIRLYMNNHKMPHDPTSMGGFFTCTMLRGAKTHPTAWRSTQSWPSCC